MRKNILFRTEKGNRYLYSEGLECNILLHPILFDYFSTAFLHNNNIESIQPTTYYEQKFKFLMEHGALQNKEISFITKPNPEDVKIKLANLRQLLFEVTDGCNLKCYYCGYGELYNNYDKRLSKKLSYEKVKTVIDYMVDLWMSPYNLSFNNVVDISFYGGEPLLNFDLIKKTIDYLREKNMVGMQFTFRMTTNGMLLDRYMDYLASENFDLLISLDGDEYANSYRLTKSGRNSFSKVYSNVLMLKDKYPDYYANKVTFNAVLHDRNSYEKIYLFIKHNLNKSPLISELNTNGVKEDSLLEFNKMFTRSYEAQQEAYKVSEEMRNDSVITNADSIQLRTMLHGNSGNMFKTLNDLLKDSKTVSHMPSGTCMAFYKKFFITVNGKALPCEKIGQKYPLGCVSDQSVDLDFNNISLLYENMYKPLLDLCKQCYNQSNCSQCVFLISEKKKSGKLTCPTFVNKNVMATLLSMNISYIENNPDVYEKIVEEDILS